MHLSTPYDLLFKTDRYIFPPSDAMAQCHDKHNLYNC